MEILEIINKGTVTIFKGQKSRWYKCFTIHDEKLWIKYMKTAFYQAVVLGSFDFIQ
ncbi:hypothetical protein [Spiroplasma poulsonii]|uniref:hypothetical protein n=1 Tax=Spiroplasma poulsonii TaxID=2138 RepID=UPI001F4D2FF2|nr:hypothetical protein [Spiroplasma poulsonii]UNF61751.1 hypothetical protein MNU24_07525 [Spiroplasma poulsonii]